MKKKKMIYYFLMVLPLLLVGLSLPFLPDQIPAHYNLDNEVTRWGSKYETLLFPTIAISIGFLMLALAKYSSKHQENGKQNEETCLLAGIVSLLVFNIMTPYFLYADFKSAGNLNALPIDLYRLIMGVLAIGFIILGKAMPSVAMNRAIGLRTTWSLKNETTWKKSQVFGGYSFIVSGISILIVCIFTKGFTCFLWAMLIIVVQLIIDIIATWKIAKNNP